VLFDCLDISCSGSVGVDELYKFLCSCPDDYLLESQRRFNEQIQESRAESAGLKAWGASKVAQEKAKASPPSVGHRGRFELELQPV